MEKILSIVWYKVLPPVFGGQKGIAHFIKELAKHSDLVCLCSRNNELTEETGYRILPDLPLSKKQFLNPIVWNKIRLVAVKEKPSCIILEHPYHGIAAKKAAKACGALLVVHSHNIESERFRQLGKWWWNLLGKYEGWIHRKADLSLFKTEIDRAIAIHKFKLQPGKCIVLPYCIEQTEPNAAAGEIIRERHGIDESKKILLFAGTLDYTPNANAVENIYRHLVPGLEKQGIVFRIIVCGKNNKKAFAYLNKLTHPSVIMTGEVQDIGNYFQAADVFINPVLSGGGIQTKTIDALSHHCNVVCFEQMAAGIPAEVAGQKLFIAENSNWNDFSVVVSRALFTKQPTPPAFFEYFSRKNNVQRFSQTLTAIINKEDARR